MIRGWWVSQVGVEPNISTRLPFITISVPPVGLLFRGDRGKCLVP